MNHFDLAKSKTAELVMHQLNSRKVVDDNVHQEVPLDWKKEMMKELAMLVPERNLPTADLATLVIRGVSKSPFAD